MSSFKFIALKVELSFKYLGLNVWIHFFIRAVLQDYKEAFPYNFKLRNFRREGFCGWSWPRNFAYLAEIFAVLSKKFFGRIHFCGRRQIFHWLNFVSQNGLEVITKILKRVSKLYLAINKKIYKSYIKERLLVLGG